MFLLAAAFREFGCQFWNLNCFQQAFRKLITFGHSKMLNVPTVDSFATDHRADNWKSCGKSFKNLQSSTATRIQRHR